MKDASRSSELRFLVDFELIPQSPRRRLETQYRTCVSVGRDEREAGDRAAKYLKRAFPAYLTRITWVRLETIITLREDNL